MNSKTNKLPRGMRNNNPLNIIKSEKINWQIISRWAPETENQVVAYIKAVSQRTGIAPDAPLPPMKQETQVLWCDIVLAMAMVECGLNGKEQQELVPYVVRGFILL